MATFNLDREFERLFPNLVNKNHYELKMFQKKVIDNVINRKQNTLCIMPTGGGKSLIYWLSGLLSNGITIVISPLIALIDEQEAKISEQGYSVLTFHAGISGKRQSNNLINLYNGKIVPDFIFVSPERIATDGMFEYCMKGIRDKIGLVVIDEVHCVSQWGTGFRPFYKRIPFFLSEIYDNDDWNTKVLALTATLNPNEVKDICKEFHIDRINIIKDEMLLRSEINLKILKMDNEDEKGRKLWELLRIHKGEKTLVYLYRKGGERGVHGFKKEAIEKYGLNAECFDGDMDAKERQKVIAKLKNNQVNIVFATNAFGMGIDIQDIECVIHFMIPESIEQYYQEVGRAARGEGRTANAYLLYSNKNIQVKKTHFINKSLPKIEEIEQYFAEIAENSMEYKTYQFFDENDVKQKCISYYLNHGLFEISCKGFGTLIDLYDIKNTDLQMLIDATKKKLLITTCKKTGWTPKQITNLIYKELFSGNVKTQKPLEKCLVVKGLVNEISEETKQEVEEEIEERREYKNGLLDYFVYKISDTSDSMQLHQEIGMYLGVPKHYLSRIYSTLKGDLVRSKSEVIISNLLYNAGIPYEYEKKLYYDGNNMILPDFTITLGEGKQLYWEHIGLLGKDNYDENWIKKLDIYDKHYQGKLIKTYEGAYISDSAAQLIEKMKMGIFFDMESDES